jgi:GTP cyclohydrolase I
MRDDVYPTMGDTIFRFLHLIGEDTGREGLLDTPQRVNQAWKVWAEGYNMNAADIIRSFEDGGEHYDEMVLERGIPFYSHCEHHIAPFFGVAHIAYIPNGRIVGLSKLPRLLDVFAHRLQVQERLTAQVADALMEGLKPKGVAVSIEARHLCMESRGIMKQNVITITNVLRGVFKTDASARHEFLSSIRP